MPDIVGDLIVSRRPSAERPLLGQTVLVVEDSRFACEAMRLLCLRSGARIRRADSLGAARRHLAVYRPSVVVIDLGLPDGPGLQLVRDLARAQPRVAVILATSGDDSLRSVALSAGADDFIAKPFTSVAAFQSAILAHLPPDARPQGLRPVPAGTVSPDPIALRDDLLHVSEILNRTPDAETLDYAAQFLNALSVCAEDRALGRAAADLAETRLRGAPLDAPLTRLASLIRERLAVGAAI